MKHRYEVLFSCPGEKRKLNVKCDTWESVDREVRCFGIENLIHIRENL